MGTVRFCLINILIAMWASAFVCTVFTSVASGAQVNWVGNGDGESWSDALNWDAGTPQEEDSVFITLGGTYIVTLDQDATILRLELGGTTGTQTLVVDSVQRVLTISDASLVNANGRLLLSGTLTGAGFLDVTGTLILSNGTVSGIGNLLVNGSVEFTGDQNTLDTREIEIAGAGIWSGGRISGLNSAILTVLPGASFDIQVDDMLSGSITINNEGTFTRSTGSGELIVDVAFNNIRGGVTAEGLLEVQTGTVALLGGGNSTGTFAVSSGAVLALGGGHSMNNQVLFTLPATSLLRIDGVFTTEASFNLIADAELKVSESGNLTLSNGADVLGSGDFAVHGVVTFSGIDTSRVEMPVLIDTSGSVEIYNALLVEDQWDIGGQVDVQSGSYVKLLDSLNAAQWMVLDSGEVVFNYSVWGTNKVHGPGGIHVDGHIAMNGPGQVEFYPSMVIDSSGTGVLEGNMLSAFLSIFGEWAIYGVLSTNSRTGIYLMDAGNTEQFYIHESGLVYMKTGTWFHNGDPSAGGVTVAGSLVASSEGVFGWSEFLPTIHILQNGQFDVYSTLYAGSQTSNMDIDGTLSIHETGNIQADYGTNTISSRGAVSIIGTAILESSSPVLCFGRLEHTGAGIGKIRCPVVIDTMTVPGQGLVSGTADISGSLEITNQWEILGNVIMHTGSKVTLLDSLNPSQWNLQQCGTMDFIGSDTPGGQILVEGHGGITIQGVWTLTGYGDIVSPYYETEPAVKIYAPVVVSTTGSVIVSSNSGYFWDDWDIFGSVIVRPLTNGWARFGRPAGAWTVHEGGVLRIEISPPTDYLIVSYRYLYPGGSDPKPIRVLGRLEISRTEGALYFGDEVAIDTTVTPTDSVIVGTADIMGDSLLFDANWSIYGAAVVRDGARFGLWGVSWSIEESGYVDFQGTASVAGDWGGEIQCSGLLRHSGNGTGHIGTWMTLNTAGQIDVISGILDLYGGGDYDGLFNIGGEANLSGGEHYFYNNSSITGNGRFAVGGGAADIGGMFGFRGDLLVSGGYANFTLDSPIIVSTMTNTGGVYTANVDLITGYVAIEDGNNTTEIIATQLVDWSGGIISGPAATTMTIDDTVRLDMFGAGLKTLDTRNLIIDGEAEMSEGELTLLNGAVVSNANSGSLSVHDGLLVSGNGTFENQGVMDVDAPGGGVVFDTPFENYSTGRTPGTVDILSDSRATMGGGGSNGSTINLQSLAEIVFTQRFLNDGIIHFGEGAICSITDTLVNRSAGYIELQDNVTFADSGAFENHGSLVKSGGTDTTDFEPFCNNIEDSSGTGSIEVLVGVLRLMNGGSNSGDIFIADGATLIIEGDYINEPGGLIYGLGTLDISNADFINNGTISPGASPGVLTINGNLNCGLSGVILIEMGGTQAGVDCDSLSVTGSINLGGTLRVSLINGFVPNAGVNCPIMGYGSFMGEFDEVDGMALGDGAYLDFEFGPNGMTSSVCEGVSDIWISDNTLQIEVMSGDTALRNLQICNNGYCPLEWTIEYLQTSPDTLTSPQWFALGGDLNDLLSRTQCADIELHASALNLGPGLYTGELVIHSNDPGGDPPNIPVELSVIPSKVEHLVIYPDVANGDIVLNWSPVVNANSYEIYSSGSANFEVTPGSFIGSTSENTFTHIGTLLSPDEIRFYAVAASREPVIAAAQQSRQERQIFK